MMRIAIVVLSAFAVGGCGVWKEAGQADATAVSPDGRNEIRLVADPLSYEIKRDGVVVAACAGIGLRVNGKCLSAHAPVRIRKEAKSGAVAMPVYKKALVDLSGNETLVDFGDWGVRLAARNDGVAYRFETRMPGRIRVDGESASVVLPAGAARCWACRTDAFGQEEAMPYAYAPSALRDECRPGAAKGERGSMVYLPFAYSVGGKHVAVTESDVRDYPIWNLVGACAETDGARFDARFAGWPEAQYHAATGTNWSDIVRLEKGGRWVKVGKHADYLTETAGTRTYPWRTFVLADAPSKFCESDIVYALAAPPDEGADFSWVKPGKVAWDWWNCFDNQGDAGCNTKTYERFIDFAAKNGVEYVILDEGWSEKLDIWKFHPDVDVPHLVAYANARGVGIVLWMAWAQVCGDEARVAEHFARLGARGFKVDFMDRGDADVARFLEKFAAECARRRMLVDYHGAYRPTGLQRRYPNIVNYEGVCGLERMKWFTSKPEEMMDNDVRAFFLRLTAGPMDYTPGAMVNHALDSGYRDDAKSPGSLGTRCRQMAMMALYEAPLQMLCDSPTHYERNTECFSFMAAVPTVWDETVGLAGDPDSFVAAARRKGDAWYVAALSNAEGRSVALDTGFLGKGEWEMEAFRDARESDRKPTSYVHEKRRVAVGEPLRIAMAPGGGFVARFVRR